MKARAVGHLEAHSALERLGRTLGGLSVALDQPERHPSGRQQENRTPLAARLAEWAAVDMIAGVEPRQVAAEPRAYGERA
jgi:hypothetical protein